MIYKEATTCVCGHFNEDYFDLHQHLLTGGDQVGSRNGSTREILNFKTVIKEPIKRCIGGHNRNINVFFLLAEALWIWAGRKDVAFLDTYNSQLKNYSDDGINYHAPYGWRMRKYGVDTGITAREENKHALQGLDQIRIALNMLAVNPEDRRVVVQIWEVEQDLQKNSRDIPCLSGDIRFFSPEGNFTIKQVYNYLKSGELDYYPIYCYNEETDEVSLQELRNVVYSGKKKILKITLQNGVVLKVTPDHRLYKRINGNNGKNKYASHFKILEAKDFKIGDILLSDVLSEDNGGHFQHKNKLFGPNGADNIRKLHREYYEFVNGEIQDGFDIHHKDHDEKNNSIINLVEIDHFEHSKEHADEKRGKLNPTNNESEAKRRLRLFKRRASLRKTGWKVPHHPDDEIYDQLAEAVLREEPLKESKIGKHSTWNIPKIISIEECEAEDVYDFNVPEFHNALFESGIVIHNCNDLIMFKIRNGLLYSTIANRSNDLNLGLTTNVFQFSFISEIMSKILGVGLGDQVHNSQSLHLYLNHEMTNELSESINDKNKSLLYDLANASSMDFSFTDSMTVDEKLRIVDFHISSIIMILNNIAKGRNDINDESRFQYEDSLKKFSRYFYYVYKLLLVFVDYKKHKVWLTGLHNLEILSNELPEFSYSDYHILALNFFTQRMAKSERAFEQEKVLSLRHNSMYGNVSCY